MMLRVAAGRIVGGDDGVGRLLALLDDAEAGRSVAALVSGDAGVGKSRLVREVAQLASGRGFTVLSGQCAELGDSVPYLPLATPPPPPPPCAGSPGRAARGGPPTRTAPAWPGSRCSAPCSACSPSS